MKRTLDFIIDTFKFIIKLYTGYFIIYGVIYLLLKLLRKKRPVTYPLLYKKELSFSLNYHSLHILQLTLQFFFTLFATALIAFIILENIAPLGATVYYSSDQNTINISPIGPVSRVQIKKIGGKKVTVQTHDLVYFTTTMPYNFDSATVQVVFQNSDPQQTLLLGFKDQEGYHYATKLIDAPLLNALSWKRIGNGPTLFEKGNKYTTINNFLQNPPKDALIGTYNYDTDIANTDYTHLSGYSPSKTQTVISTPLRGRVVMYTYLQHEPFILHIQKQDLNWYEDPDVVTVKVYKGTEMVYQTTIDDDGITDASKRVLSPQEVTIKNPGPGFPEDGVYKVVIDASGDTVIRQISTNLHKIVFQGSIFPAENSLSYSTMFASTSATTVFTNALLLSATTVHKSGEQNISVGNQTLSLNTVNIPESITPKDVLTRIVIPKNDVILSGLQGYFAFSPDQFFLPTPYHIIPISGSDDLSLVDYVLTDYIPPKNIGSWQVATRSFDLSTAVMHKGTLSWVLDAPKLQDNNGQIIIRSIAITFHKNSWFQ